MGTIPFPSSLTLEVRPVSLPRLEDGELSAQFLYADMRSNLMTACIGRP